MNRTQFFEIMLRKIDAAVPPELGPLQRRNQGHLLKLFYGNEQVHYEVWPDSGRQKIEIGLHFEDGPISTTAYLAYFDERIIELKHLLGAELELERWTTSWGHLFFERPWQTLDAELAGEIGNELTSLITIVEPLVRIAAVPAEQAAARQNSRNAGRWTRRAR